MKYIGSKSRIAKDIVPIIQKHIDDNSNKVYFEPFVGGANVIDKIKCKHRIGFDINEYLIRLFQYIQAGGEIPESISNERYSEVRANKEKFPKWYVGCVGFLASYNGKFFGGYAGRIHAKTGTVRDYYDEARRNVLKQANYLNYVNFEHWDYREVNEKYNFENCTIYCDPPYEKTMKYSGVENFDHEEFWEVMRNWSRQNVVIISEQKAPSDFECIWQKEIIRTNDNASRFYVTEKLFKHAA